MYECNHGPNDAAVCLYAVASGESTALYLVPLRYKVNGYASQVGVRTTQLQPQMRSLCSLVTGRKQGTAAEVVPSASQKDSCAAVVQGIARSLHLRPVDANRYKLRALRLRIDDIRPLLLLLVSALS